MRKNVACTLTYTAWDTDANAPKTGDAANHTMRLVTDGTAGAIAASPAEVENGEYKIVIAAGENTGLAMTLEGSSSTTDIEIIPVKWTNEVDANVTFKAGGKYKVADTTGNWAAGPTWSDGVAPVANQTAGIIIRDGITVTVAASLDLGPMGTQELQGDAKLDIAGAGVTVPVIPRGWFINDIKSSAVVTINYGTIKQFSTEVGINYGRIIYNKGGTLATNGSGGIVDKNPVGATITNNGGVVLHNAGTITTNDVGGRVNNTGTITTQDAGGICHNYGGTIGTDNGATNEYQTGDVYAQLPSNFSATVISVAGIVDVSMTHILGHLLAQTGTQIADNFQTFFDVGTQTFTSGTALAGFKATGFNIVVPPSVVEFEARTLVTAEYATLAGQSTIAGYTDTLETLGATIAGYTDSLETATAALQGTANSIFTDTGTTLHQFVDEVESLLKNVTYGLAALKTALDLVPQIAAGGIATVVECKVGGVPVDGVEVWLTTDEAGANVVHGTIVSDAFGLANFGVIDSGTYFVWRQIAGMDFSNPQSITVS